MFCLWCGARAEGTTTLRCTACDRILYLHSKLSASALVVCGDEYLVVRRAAEPELGKWDLPGGFCEYGEHPAEAARREAFEECGLHVVVDEVLGLWMDGYDEPDGSTTPTANLVYAAHLADEADRSAAGTLRAGETDGLRWLPLDAPPADPAFADQQLGALAALRR